MNMRIRAPIMANRVGSTYEPTPPISVCELEGPTKWNLFSILAWSLLCIRIPFDLDTKGPFYSESVICIWTTYGHTRIDHCWKIEPHIAVGIRTNWNPDCIWYSCRGSGTECPVGKSHRTWTLYSMTMKVKESKNTYLFVLTFVAVVTICHWIIRFTQTKANICITIGPIYVIAVARVTARYGPQMRSAVIGGICGNNFTFQYFWLLVRYQALIKVDNCDWCSKKLFFVY